MIPQSSFPGLGFSRRKATSLAGIVLASLVLAGCGGDSGDQLGGPGASNNQRGETAAGAKVLPAETGDIVSENQLPGSKLWRRGVSRATDVASTGVYADQSSIFAGDSVQLFVSTESPKWRAQVFRMGSYGGKGARLVWESASQPGVVQDQSGYIAETRTHYAKWQSSITLASDEWQPGMYLIRIVGSSGADWLVPLVVRSEDVEDRLVLVMSDLTWQAYNLWGGRSTYEGPYGGREDRARAVSFARPYTNGNGSGKYLAHEHAVVQLAEAEGLPVSYVAASDLATDDDALAGASGVVFLGHDEYWTTSSRAQVTKARDSGTDLAFLGANTMYWRVRFSEDGPSGLPLETVYKSADEDPVSGAETTARFRDPPSPDPERSLVGQEYECYPAEGTYTVTEPNFFAFEGTGISRGGTVPAIVDVEIDRAYPGGGTPDNLQIVAASPTTCTNAQTLSTSTYYSHESGAGVFSTGTMGWVLRGLRGPQGSRAREFTETVTLNVMRTMAEGSMGGEHPAVGNIDDYDLPTQNTTGSA